MIHCATISHLTHKIWVKSISFPWRVIKRLFHREYQPRKNKQFVRLFHNLKYRIMYYETLLRIHIVRILPMCLLKTSITALNWINKAPQKNSNILNENEYMNLNAKQHRLHLQWQMQRTKMPEKLLPHYLNNASVFMIGMRAAISHWQTSSMSHSRKNLDNLKMKGQSHRIPIVKYPKLKHFSALDTKS